MERYVDAIPLLTPQKLAQAQSVVDWIEPSAEWDRTRALPKPVEALVDALRPKRLSCTQAMFANLFCRNLNHPVAMGVTHVDILDHISTPLGAWPNFEQNPSTRQITYLYLKEGMVERGRLARKSLPSLTHLAFSSTKSQWRRDLEKLTPPLKSVVLVIDDAERRLPAPPYPLALSFYSRNDSLQYLWRNAIRINKI